ncbi:NUDIX domain-containing protein [Hoeflea sp. E7-10]|uniref:NUDIX domain-containing protein n=1 Tax=Hoeflea poritis TaxID=2993659 RepID=A0ABT4VRM5_9HYPH|nr:NUDIX domain-containing protein [Hoeflea poritis]MDA4847367.1 NUDIX domain-containing protein [Hoeflea poritis]
MDVGDMGKSEHGAGHSRPATIGQGTAHGSPPPYPAPGRRNLAQKTYQWLLNRLFAAQRPLTLGVRAAAFDRAGRIFLVRHTYVRGWYMPGGGVEVGETVYDALERELAEEGNLAMAEPPQLFAVYHNNRSSRRDHVVFFTCKNVSQSEIRRPDLEIADSGFFALDALPEGVTGATQRRLAELSGDVPPDSRW